MLFYVKMSMLLYRVRIWFTTPSRTLWRCFSTTVHDVRRRCRVLPASQGVPVTCHLLEHLPVHHRQPATEPFDYRVISRPLHMNWTDWLLLAIFPLALCWVPTSSRLWSSSSSDAVADPAFLKKGGTHYDAPGTKPQVGTEAMPLVCG